MLVNIDMPELCIQSQRLFRENSDRWSFIAVDADALFSVKPNEGEETAPPNHFSRCRR